MRDMKEGGRKWETTRWGNKNLLVGHGSSTSNPYFKQIRPFTARTDSIEPARISQNLSIKRKTIAADVFEIFSLKGRTFTVGVLQNIVSAEGRTSMSLVGRPLA